MSGVERPDRRREAARTDGPGAAADRSGRGTRELFVALALASVLPLAATAWPGSVPREVALPAILAAAGILGVTAARVGRELPSRDRRPEERS